MEIYDITVPMQTALAVWPGDTPFRFTWNQRKRDGSSVNLGTLEMSVHTGTHADAPYHFHEGGTTIDACDLEVYCGRAVVIDVRGISIIRKEDLPPNEMVSAPRVLLRTDSWLDHSRFPVSVPVLDVGVPAYLREHGVVLIGVDMPSVDPIDSKTLDNHHALAEAGISILESVSLSDITPGVYELIALPLKVIGADGAPVRAILRR